MDDGLELMLLGISFILFGILMGNNGGMFFGILGLTMVFLEILLPQKKRKEKPRCEGE
ncbi:hypothetical protein [Thermococcus sp. LS1]|uniref:hypothetical protein n=1 Tax=Thermococcus sp. LS1 TaxID=1638259 RepID=UPI001439CD4D|nr:hypothetical protein [Thermococcus sp. LS1]